MKVLYITTVSDTMSFFTAHIKMLKEDGHTVDLACNVGRPIPYLLKGMVGSIFNIKFRRSPLMLSNIQALINLRRILRCNSYDLIHTHTPVASVLSRLACIGLLKTKVFYTAHGFHFYRGAPWINWMLYYPIEKLLAHLTDVLITINNEDYNIASRKLKAKEIVYIPGVGVKSKPTLSNYGDKMQARKKLGINYQSFLLVSVGELNQNKNHEIVLHALKEIADKNVEFAVCGDGDLKEYLISLAEKMGISSQVHILGYQSDISEILRAADVYIHSSFREGLSVAVMEAMAAGLPVICSNIRGNNDLIKNLLGGLLINKWNVDNYKEAILYMKNLSEADRKKYGNYNKIAVQEFSEDKVIEALRKVFSKYS